MKKPYITFARLAMAASVACITMVACAPKEEGAAASKQAQKGNAAVPATLNIRYIDGDSVSAHYNLAKDFQEQYIRTLSRMQQAEQAKTAEIQKFGASIEQKMRSNGYLTEESYNADMARFSKMQQDASNQLSTLQRNSEAELARQQQELNDSIMTYIKEYNKTKGYDAILFKAAGVYFNPALDITDEVVEGLNARYNKVKPESK